MSWFGWGHSDDDINPDFNPTSPDAFTISTPDPITVSTPNPITVSTPDLSTPDIITPDPFTISTPDPITVSTPDFSTPNPFTISTPPWGNNSAREHFSTVTRYVDTLQDQNPPANLDEFLTTDDRASSGSHVATDSVDANPNGNNSSPRTITVTTSDGTIYVTIIFAAGNSVSIKLTVMSDGEHNSSPRVTINGVLAERVLLEVDNDDWVLSDL